MTCIFIGGSQRTGTTLLQTILCRDNTTNPMVHEAKYFRQLIQAYVFGKRQFAAETNGYFDDVEALRKFHAGVIEHFLEHVLKRFNNARNLVLKEPHLTMVFPDISELISSARFICIIRDPRDVIASMVRVGQKLAEKGINNDPMAQIFNKRDMRILSQHFKSFYMPVLRNSDPELGKKCIFLRYEDLVQSPGPVLERLRKFTGLSLDGFDSDSDPGTGKVNFDAADPYRSAWVSKLYGKKISSDRIGTHKDVLTSAEVDIIEQSCQGMMTRFKYSLTSSVN